jgi:hypothetical protein
MALGTLPKPSDYFLGTINHAGPEKGGRIPTVMYLCLDLSRRARSPRRPLRERQLFGA